MKHLCNVAGCEHQAVRYPRVQVWPVGGTADDEPAQFVLPMAICVVHQEDFPLQQFFTPAQRADFNATMAALGKRPLDFDSAKIAWGRVGDADWFTAGGQ